ncbi:hypothetical protein ACTXT7_011534 [Hymenolepis weldensis]
MTCPQIHVVEVGISLNNILSSNVGAKYAAKRGAIAVKYIGLSTTSASLTVIRNWWICGRDRQTFADITISNTGYVAQTNINHIGIDWLGLLGLIDLSINNIYSHKHSTSNSSSTAEKMIPRSPVVSLKCPVK